MKKSLLLMTFVFGVSYSAWAGPCGNAALSVYDAPTFSCNIGDITFSNFGYSPSGSILIPDSSVQVKPETIGPETGFQFNAPWGVPPGGTIDSGITYTATCDTLCSIDDLVLAIAGAGSSGNGFISVTESSPALGTTSLSTSWESGFLTSTDSATFFPTGSVSVTKDVLINGGTAPGTTQVSFVTNLLSTTSNGSTVPEPPLVLLSAGLLALVPFARRKFGRSALQPRPRQGDHVS